jgi:hypothetical protein
MNIEITGGHGKISRRTRRSRLQVPKTDIALQANACDRESEVEPCDSP